MTTVLLDDSHLSAIGEAIREKNGTEETYKPREMAAAIAALQGSIDIPVITGDCNGMFNKNRWNWLIDQYGDQIVTEDITNASSMFSSSTKLESVPFDLNCDNSESRTFSSTFAGCNKLTKIGDIVDAYMYNATQMFVNCYLLRYLPNFINLKTIKTYNLNLSYMFSGCYSLRNISEDLLSYLHSDSWVTNSYALTYGGFENCWSLDEIKGIRLNANRFTSNSFSHAFYYCQRVKDITFATREGGSPYALSFRGQTIDLTTVGWGPEENVINYNSGITSDKHVYNDETYQALKNDPDWYATDQLYSRYNYNSAVRTINTLPNTSGWVTSTAPNTIKFTANMGELTDGGPISNLTEEEIAVATAKGWTVAFE